MNKVGLDLLDLLTPEKLNPVGTYQISTMAHKGQKVESKGIILPDDDDDKVEQVVSVLKVRPLENHPL